MGQEDVILFDPINDYVNNELAKKLVMESQIYKSATDSLQVCTILFEQDNPDTCRNVQSQWSYGRHI